MSLTIKRLLKAIVVAVRDRTPLKRVFEGRLVARYGIARGLEQVEPSPVVMTDYMDTLIRRDLTILEVIERWSSIVGERFCIDPKLLYDQRLALINGGKHNTITTEAIYEIIARDCVSKGLLAESQHEGFCALAHSTEFDLEMGAQSVIPSTRDFLASAKRAGSRIACVTDLRFSGTDVKTMLEMHGVLDLFDQVISSADVGTTKQEGSLYDDALKIIGTTAPDCLMIGDNLQSDCVNAAKHGIRSCWVA